MVSSAPPSAARAAGRCCARPRSNDGPPAATTAIATVHVSVDLTRNRGAFMVGEAYTILFSTGQNRACPSSRASEASRGAVVYSPRFFHSFAQEELGHMGHWLVVISARGLLIVLLFFSTSSAQSVATAQINGDIKDQSGAGLPGVTITVTQTDTGLTRSAVSGEEGPDILQDLPTGPYRFEAELQGFRKFVQTGLVLQVTANPTLNVTLQLGQVAETITVQGTAAPAETRNPGVGQSITHRQRVDVPLNGRQLTELVFQAGLATGGKATGDAPGPNALNTGVRSYPNTTTIVARVPSYSV